MTNLLTKVSLSNKIANDVDSDVPRHVLIRQYGIANDDIINRDTEHKIFEKFAQSGVGPALHGYFNGGRVEEFLEARPLLYVLVIFDIFHFSILLTQTKSGSLNFHDT